jgi:hypothetical protein
MKPQTGEVKVNSKGQIAIAIHNGSYCAEKGYNDNEVTLSDKTEAECTLIVWAWSYTDSDSSSTVNVGDEITFGTESFYVISNDGTDIIALAKYNLYVGGTSIAYDWTAYGDEATGLQDSTMLGYVLDQTDRYGTTFFSLTSNVYEGSKAKEYVDAYEDKLINLGAIELDVNSTRLITIEELETLGCSGTDCTISAPSFVYSTSYWSDARDDHETDLFSVFPRGPS